MKAERFRGHNLSIKFFFDLPCHKPFIKNRRKTTEPVTQFSHPGQYQQVFSFNCPMIYCFGNPIGRCLFTDPGLGMSGYGSVFTESADLQIGFNKTGTDNHHMNVPKMLVSFCRSNVFSKKGQQIFRRLPLSGLIAQQCTMPTIWITV